MCGVVRPVRRALQFDARIRHQLSLHVTYTVYVVVYMMCLAERSLSLTYRVTRTRQRIEAFCAVMAGGRVGVGQGGAHRADIPCDTQLTGTPGRASEQGGERVR